MLSGAHGYNVDYYDCQSPTRIERFARSTTCDMLPLKRENSFSIVVYLFGYIAPCQMRSLEFNLKFQKR